MANSHYEGYHITTFFSPQEARTEQNSFSFNSTSSSQSFTTATRGIVVEILSVCPSVRQNLLYICVNRVVKILTPFDDPIIIVFCDLISLPNFNGPPHATEASNTGGV